MTNSTYLNKMNITYKRCGSSRFQSLVISHWSLVIAFLVISHWSLVIAAETLTPEVQAQVDAVHKEMVEWAANPIIVNAVKAQNAKLPAEYAELNEEKWTALTVMDPIVRSFTKNEAALFLKTKRNDFVDKIFLSDANGCKVAFLAKTTNWCHKGKPKHEDPMSGKNWEGPVEVDASVGVMMKQVSVPVLDQGKPIGSLVVGLKVSK